MVAGPLFLSEFSELSELLLFSELSEFSEFSELSELSVFSELSEFSGSSEQIMFFYNIIYPQNQKK